MKLLLAIVIGIHGLIHLIGFLKAFGFGQFPMLSEPIGRVQGSLWLLACLLLIFSTVLFYTDQKVWPWIGLAAVALSQILILLSWSDAKHGSWINLIFIVVILIGIAQQSFNQKVEAEVSLLYSANQTRQESNPINLADQDLPPVVRLWLQNAGVEGRKNPEMIHLKQNGRMRMKPEGKWMPFSAEQWFDAKHVGFIWKTRVGMAGPLFLTGRDKLISGKGRMDISLLSLVPVVQAGSDPRIDQASKLRFLAETCWFPTAALEPYILWEELGGYSARATLRTDPRVSGVFTFNEKGEMTSFRARRYMGAGVNAKLETWVVKNTSFARFDGIKIPKTSEVYWELDDGSFHWLSLEITEINYD